MGRLLGARHHLDAGVTGLMASQVVAVTEGLVTVSTDKRRFAFVLLLYYRHRRPLSCSAGHIVFEEFSGTDRWLLV